MVVQRQTTSMDPLQTSATSLSYNQQTRYPEQTQKCLSRQHPPTLKELLQQQKAPQQLMGKTSLSPSGTFKYIRRQNAKACYNNYGAMLKPPIFTNQERVRRPLNCFMVFSHLERRRVADEHPELHNADLSKILGKRWKTLSPHEKQPYIDEAERIRQLHTEIYPDYKYQPRRKSQLKKGVKKGIEEGKNKEKREKETEKTKDATDDDSIVENAENEENNKSDEISSTITSSTTTTATTTLQLPCFSQQNKRGPVQESGINTMTPVASTYYGNQVAYDQMLQNDINNNNKTQITEPLSYPSTPEALRSFPPTPEVSPITVNRGQPVFLFEGNEYLAQNFQQNNQAHGMLRNFREAQQGNEINDINNLGYQYQHQQEFSYQNYYPPSYPAYYNQNISYDFAPGQLTHPINEAIHQAHAQTGSVIN